MEKFEEEIEENAREQDHDDDQESEFDIYGNDQKQMPYFQVSVYDPDIRMFVS